MLGIGVGAPVLAFGLSLVPMPGKTRAALALAGPVAAIIVFAIAAPDCSYDCPDRAAWALALALAAGGWLLGFGISALVRRASGRD